MSEKQITADIAAMPFEEAVAELEQLVAKMEAGGQNIDQLMNFFERGCYLTRHCRSYLANMEKKISLLTRDDGKEGEWTDFDADSGKRNSVPF